MHVVAQWSEKACFFMSKQALTLQFVLSKNSIEQTCQVSKNLSGLTKETLTLYSNIFMKMLLYASFLVSKL